MNLDDVIANKFKKQSNEVSIKKSLPVVPFESDHLSTGRYQNFAIYLDL